MQVLNSISHDNILKQKFCFSLHRKTFLPFITVPKFHQLLRFELCCFPCLPHPAVFFLSPTKTLYHNESPSCVLRISSSDKTLPSTNLTSNLTLDHRHIPYHPCSIIQKLNRNALNWNWTTINSPRKVGIIQAKQPSAPS